MRTELGGTSWAFVFKKAIYDTGNARTALRAGNLWREPLENVSRVRRSAVIRTIKDYPSQELAQAAVNGLRMQINEGRNRLPQQTVQVADLIDHYLDTELAAAWHSHATRLIYREFLVRWIKPHWSSS